MQHENEHRAVELRSESEGVLSGILIPYGVGSRIGGKFTETFKSGSIGAIGEIRANVMHDRARAVAVHKPGGGLSFENTADSLRVRVELPATQEGKDTGVLVARGVLSGLSAEFRARRDVWQGTQRTILGACRELAPSKQESTTYEPSLVCKLLILGCRLLIPDRLLEAEIRGVGIVDTPAHDGALVELEARYKASENRGAALVALIEGALPDEGDTERPARIAAASAAAGIAPETMMGILRGEIALPPRERLVGFSQALDIPLDRLIDSVIQDGGSRDVYEQRSRMRRRLLWV